MTVATPATNPAAGSGPDISRQELRTLIDAFYQKVRAHPRLGPIFNGKIGSTDSEWAPHLDKIENFWANVIRRERVYRGNPMQKHMALPDIEVGDFAIWLSLFEETAHACLPRDKAVVMDNAARRIGCSLAMGIERARPSGPPSLAI